MPDLSPSTFAVHHGRRVARHVVCCLGACATLAACDAAMASEPPREYESVSPRAPDTLHRDHVPGPLLEEVLVDASRRTQVAARQLEILSTQKVTWSDGSLGCPQPGGMYTQALVPGYRIWVRHAGGVLDYHASDKGAFIVCPAVTIEPEAPVAR